MDPATIGTVITLGAKALDAFISHKEKKKAKKAQRKAEEEAARNLAQIPQINMEAYNPFIEQAARAEAQLYPEYMYMFEEPESFYEDLLSGYEPSALYNYKRSQLERAAHNTAASKGYLGTKGDVEARLELVNSLLNSDIENYLNNIYGVYGRGLQGLETRAGRGFEAATGLAHNLSNAAQQRATYDLYRGVANQNAINEASAARQELFNRITGGNTQNNQPGNGGYGPSGGYIPQQQAQQGYNWQGSGYDPNWANMSMGGK